MSSSRPLPTEEDLEAIREGVRAVCRPFDDEYWLARDNDGKFPREFHRAMAEAGWLGITMPEEFGGAGLGVTEAMTMIREVASCGGGFAASSTIHINLFGPHPIVVNAWALAPREESEWLRKYRLFNFTEFLGPGGFATPDDVEAIKKCQRGYAVGGDARYNDISKGMLREGGAAYDDELQMRAFWTEWDRRLAKAEA